MAHWAGWKRCRDRPYKPPISLSPSPLSCFYLMSVSLVPSFSLHLVHTHTHTCTYFFSHPCLYNTSLKHPTHAYILQVWGSEVHDETEFWDSCVIERKIPKCAWLLLLFCVHMLSPWQPNPCPCLAELFILVLIILMQRVFSFLFFFFTKMLHCLCIGIWRWVYIIFRSLPRVMVKQRVLY